MCTVLIKWGSVFTPKCWGSDPVPLKLRLCSESRTFLHRKSWIRPWIQFNSDAYSNNRGACFSSTLVCGTVTSVLQQFDDGYTYSSSERRLASESDKLLSNVNRNASLRIDSAGAQMRCACHQRMLQQTGVRRRLLYSM